MKRGRPVIRATLAQQQQLSAAVLDLARVDEQILLEREQRKTDLETLMWDMNNRDGVSVSTLMGLLGSYGNRPWVTRVVKGPRPDGVTVVPDVLPGSDPVFDIVPAPVTGDGSPVPGLFLVTERNSGAQGFVTGAMVDADHDVYYRPYVVHGLRIPDGVEGATVFHEARVDPSHPLWVALKNYEGS